MKSILSRLLVWWYATDSMYLQARITELEAESERIAQDLQDTRWRLIKSEMRQLQHARPA